MQKRKCAARFFLFPLIAAFALLFLQTFACEAARAQTSNDIGTPAANGVPTASSVPTPIDSSTPSATASTMPTPAVSSVASPTPIPSFQSIVAVTASPTATRELLFMVAVTNTPTPSVQACTSTAFNACQTGICPRGQTCKVVSSGEDDQVRFSCDCVDACGNAATPACSAECPRVGDECKYIPFGTDNFGKPTDYRCACVAKTCGNAETPMCRGGGCASGETCQFEPAEPSWKSTCKCKPPPSDCKEDADCKSCYKCIEGTCRLGKSKCTLEYIAGAPQCNNLNTCFQDSNRDCKCACGTAGNVACDSCSFCKNTAPEGETENWKCLPRERTSCENDLKPGSGVGNRAGQACCKGNTGDERQECPYNPKLSCVFCQCVCTSDADCDTDNGEFCANGQCVKKTLGNFCTDRSQCHPCEDCVGNQCQLDADLNAECSAPNTCPGGAQCNVACRCNKPCDASAIQRCADGDINCGRDEVCVRNGATCGCVKTCVKRDQRMCSTGSCSDIDGNPSTMPCILKKGILDNKYGCNCATPCEELTLSCVGGDCLDESGKVKPNKKCVQQADVEAGVYKCVCIDVTPTPTPTETPTGTVSPTVEPTLSALSALGPQ